MRFRNAALLALPLAALAFTPTRDAAACGGDFQDTTVQQSKQMQVSGHRMILSIAQTQTTLWDQIAYKGDPASFAWVLPIKGLVTVDLSSDALFENLDQRTQVTVQSPVITCPPPPSCGSSSGFAGASGSGTGGGVGGGPVTVVAQSVIGPYETVQLKSADPMALVTWLQGHGYTIPTGIDAVIAAYVNEGFDFLALKLVPGQGIAAMKPVRVTTPGASTVLPLRMVAAGTTLKMPIVLWVFGEGRYEPTSFPSFVIDEKDVVWNWDTMASNYPDLVTAGLAAGKGDGWLVEAAEPTSTFDLTATLTNLAMTDPKGSGYADAMGNGAPAAAQADLDTLFGGINPAALWVTRLHAEPPRTALLAGDLTLGASAMQTTVNRTLTAAKTTGTAPTCPMYPPCPTTSSSSGATGTTGAGGAPGMSGSSGNTGGAGGASGTGTGSTSGGGSKAAPSFGGCAIGPATEARGMLGGVLAALGLALGRRRRAAKRA